MLYSLFFYLIIYYTIQDDFPMSLSFEMFKLYVVLSIVVGEVGHTIKNHVRFPVTVIKSNS